MLKSLLFILLSFTNAIALSSNIVGVEILVTDRGDALESKFGHGLIRLIDDDNLWANDKVISFAAAVENNKTSILKGVFGGYEVQAQMRTMFEYWDIYGLSQKRGFVRYPLTLSELELEHFIKTLDRYIQDPSIAGHYKFFSNNCATLITKVFQDAGLADDRDNHHIPISIESWINKNLYANHLSIQTKIFKNTLSDFNSLSHYDDDYLAYSYSFGDYQFEDMMTILAEIKKRKININDFYGLESLPLSFYQKDAENDEARFYNQEQLHRLSVKRYLLSLDYTQYELSELYFHKRQLLYEYQTNRLSLFRHRLSTKENQITWKIEELGNNLSEQITLDLKGLKLNRKSKNLAIHQSFEIDETHSLAIIKEGSTFKLYLLY